ncbi:DUF305 domain-containing protein [[Mycobacterium] crassicus]|uniref:DUF305 domain-containing protein n=1 Tax=[Mycobacterium] crassicus TaxID=2872309 RepID=A0ABU5XD51_9MYCO|nr:DUF305 domain-containing protein [Mycolicibacter sp. MYC098]MEB3020230.1 DUF305 domain-containing protein [Mycolicibacter sp. MYC098]
MRTVFTVAVAIVVSIAAGACHSPAPDGPNAASETRSSSSPTGAATGSAGDIAFLENMVAHHQQALELTALVYGRSTDSTLLALANQITAQQQTELQGCQAQLLQWEAPGNPSARDHAEIPGMADQATIDKLRNLHGAAFDTLWLDTMISHHRGAITMAHNEIEHGQSPEAISIAQSLLPRQQADIDQMTAMLGER